MTQKNSNRVEVSYSNSNHKLRKLILFIFTHLESTYHASVIPWIYFGSAIIGYILVQYLYIYTTIDFCLFWWNASVYERFSLIQCRFSAYFMIHGFLEAGDKFYGLFAPMVFIILYQKRQLLCATSSISRVLAALFSSTNFFWYKNHLAAPCCVLMWIGHEFLFEPRGNWIINIGPYVVI